MTVTVPVSKKPLLLKWIRCSYKTLRFLLHNPRLFWMQKLGRFDWLRSGIVWLRRTVGPVPVVEVWDSPVCQAVIIEEVAVQLEVHGFCAGLTLPSETMTEILDFAATTPCWGDRNPAFLFYPAEKAALEAKLNRKFRTATYEGMPCKAAEELAQDPGILAIAAYYLAASPVFIGYDLTWSYPTVGSWRERLYSGQVFHCDLTDYRSINFFFYLTDVDAESGPHVAIRGTHRYKLFKHQWLGERCASIPDGQLVHDYGAENVVTFYGKAGDGFVEDPMCFHKGAVPLYRSRLMLKLEFATQNYRD